VIAILAFLPVWIIVYMRQGLQMKTSTGILIAFLVILPVAAAALSEENDDLTFCHFGPKILVQDPVVDPSDDDECRGTAKIQAVMWKCTKADLVETQTGIFKKELVKQATKECQQLCRRRDRKCSGRFEGKAGCGLENNREDAVIMGQRQGCRKDCDGPAFAYCSLYNAGFRSKDPEYMADARPNCRCYKTSK